MTAARILYVDDDEFIRELVEFALALDPELEVRTADSGPAGIAAVRDGGFKPDLLLLDVMMPQMDGPTTLAELRKLPVTRDTPAAFCTARAQPHEQQSLRDAGAVAVLTEPFDPMRLAAEVRAILAKAAPST